MMVQFQSYDQIAHPYRMLLEGNANAIEHLASVIGSLTDEQLCYKLSGSKGRTIAEMMSHSLCEQRCDFTNAIVLGKKEACSCKTPGTVKEALRMIQDAVDFVEKTWPRVEQKALEEVVTTEWGQTMTKRVALFQSVNHLMYHVGEICAVAGVGGFYKGVLG